MYGTHEIIMSVQKQISYDSHFVYTDDDIL